MGITLDHMVIYTRNHQRAAKEFAEIMDLPIGRIAGANYDFSAVTVNFELAIYFMNREEGNLSQHFAFNVDGQTFTKIVHRLQEKHIPFGNSPFDTQNQQTNHDFAPRGLFWENEDGCLFELMTYE